MCALYAFMRRTDDLADQPAAPEAKLAALAQWRIDLHRAIAGEPAAWPGLLALGDTVRKHAIPPKHLDDVIDGVLMDVEPRSFATFDDLYPYCYRVASAVGLACIHLWGFESEGGRAEAMAESCGIALQLTNIVRDVREDAGNARVYLPQGGPRSVRGLGGGFRVLVAEPSTSRTPGVRGGPRPRLLSRGRPAGRARVAVGSARFKGDRGDLPSAARRDRGARLRCAHAEGLGPDVEEGGDRGSVAGGVLTCPPASGGDVERWDACLARPIADSLEATSPGPPARGDRRRGAGGALGGNGP